MEIEGVVAVVRALNAARAHYLIVGGLAVVAHGYVRLTKDLDLVLDLDRANLGRALPALAALGYVPLVPVALQDFADAAKRRLWVAEKNARVFQLFSEEHRSVRIDLFLDEPLNFGAARRRALVSEVVPGVEACFVGLDDLLFLKRAAGRPQDLIDIARLETIRRRRTDA